jgi:hypothetical protein
LAKALRRVGAIVVTVTLQPGPGGSKNGVDDFIVANGPAAFAELIRRASEPTEGVDAMDLKEEEGLETPESLPVLGRVGYVIKGLATVLSAPPKAGKSSLVYQCIKEWLDAGETVLYLTEESRPAWRHRLISHDLIDRRGLKLVFGLGISTDDLLERVRRGEESVVLVDTLRGLGVLGEDENNNSLVAKEIEPWLTACRDAGKSFVGLHHDRKTGGSHGRGVAGAHALVGAVDVILQLEFGRAANERRLTALSRLTQPPPLSYMRQDDGTFSVIDGSVESAPDDVLTNLPTDSPGWTVDDLVREVGISKPNALASLTRGVESGDVLVSGTGVKGNPKRYRFKGDE